MVINITFTIYHNVVFFFFFLLPVLLKGYHPKSYFEPLSLLFCCSFFYFYVLIPFMILEISVFRWTNIKCIDWNFFLCIHLWNSHTNQIIKHLSKKFSLIPLCSKYLLSELRTILISVTKYQFCLFFNHSNKTS